MKKWTVEYKSVEEIVIEADTEEEAIAKAQKMPTGNFHMVENDWVAYEYSE